MEVALPGPLALDCEDMFKEITKKLYGEEGALDYQGEHDDGAFLKPEDHITAFGLAALMQNGFPPPGILHANFQPKTNPAAEDKWTASEETLQWTASHIASYNPAQKLFKCIDCECVGFLSRVAEHWLGTHSNARVFQCPQCAYGSAWARCVRLHLVREHSMPDDRGTDALVKNNPVLDEVTKYLQRLKTKVDGMTPAVAPAAAGRAPTASPPATPAAAGTVKRYGCPACPYATDRRDLFTRHENIHRDEKPFECYVCQKQFNRADHVKKHFLRMHRDHPYDLNRIRRQIPKTSPSNNYYPKMSADIPQNQPVQQQGDQAYTSRGHVKAEHHLQVKAEQEGAPGGKAAGGKKKGEKRYSCCYCPWSGVDNWCLKRHLNTHLKPFVCGLCDYKAARSERLATHVSKVHNKKACGKCSFLAEDQAQLTIHLQEQHHVENRNIKVPNSMLRPSYPAPPAAQPTAMPTFGSTGDGGGRGRLGSMRTWRLPKQQGAARLFHYMEASDGSDQDQDHTLPSPHILDNDGTQQDFPEAGDVGFAAEMSGLTAATSPADQPKPNPKRRVPRIKNSRNKENIKTNFQCNICFLAYKSPALLTEHSRLHVSNTLRSPLLASNAKTHFVFDNEECLEDSSPTSWELDENGGHLKRSRKQSQPKKIVQSTTSEAVTNTLTEPQKQLNWEIYSISESPAQADQMSLHINSKRETHQLTQSFREESYHQMKKMILSEELKSFREVQPVLKLSNMNISLTKLAARRARSGQPFVVFKCKRCRMKFTRKHEIKLHFKYCKDKSKPTKLR